MTRLQYSCHLYQPAGRRKPTGVVDRRARGPRGLLHRVRVDVLNDECRGARTSPLTFVANVKTPTLIQHGMDDARAVHAE